MSPLLRRKEKPIFELTFLGRRVNLNRCTFREIRREAPIGAMVRETTTAQLMRLLPWFAMRAPLRWTRLFWRISASRRWIWTRWNDSEPRWRQCAPVIRGTSWARRISCSSSMRRVVWKGRARCIPLAPGCSCSATNMRSFGSTPSTSSITERWATVHAGATASFPTTVRGAVVCSIFGVRWFRASRQG